MRSRGDDLPALTDGLANACLAAAVAGMLLVGCADDGPVQADDPSATSAEADAEIATCQAAGDMQQLLSAAGTGSSPQQADRTTAAVRDLANAANRTDNAELRSNASHLLVEWEQVVRRSERSAQPTAAADDDAISAPLRAIVDECERLGVRPAG